MSSDQEFFVISGKVDDQRIESRLLEEQIQKAVAQGHTRLLIKAYGQHGIGGRLWKAGDKKVYVRISGPVGQRTGSLGFENTVVEIMGPTSDDIGWLNAGAEIIVHGNATNGACNGMAQGKVFIAGNIGARGMTMTKHNPRFAPPELWVLGSVGDYFGEFMAGGIAVICGYDAQNPKNILGYRPLVGMVGGKVFFRGPHQGFSQTDAIMQPIDDASWQWLSTHVEQYLETIQRQELLSTLNQRQEWQMLRARTPQERIGASKRTMSAFHNDVWDATLGRGGLVGDLTDLDRSVVPVITRGDLRRFVPVWENYKYMAPCEATCPTGIPVQQRWRLVRDGRVDEAVDLALAYTPFPATVCGYLCPNPCMGACTKSASFLAPVDVTQLGKASLKAGIPELPPLSGKKIAVIGGGPAGISVAWQLRLKGHEAVVFDDAAKLGGKIAASIPSSRIPQDVFDKEIERVREVISHVNLQQKLSRRDTEQLVTDYDFVVIATGAQKPRILPIPGNERLITAQDFLEAAKAGKTKTIGKQVVIIGAGNVGCDVATEACRLGAEKITLLDVQEPASFGKEREEADKAGAKFRWPVFTKAITDDGVQLDNGEMIPADTVFISIGDVPDLDFLPESIALERGYIKVNEDYQTSDPKVFAIGDVVRQGLLTNAIGAGRRAAQTIDAIASGKRPTADPREMIDISRVSVEYFDPRVVQYEDIGQCGSQCASCGQCRDCGICVAICPETAISRQEKEGSAFEYIVDATRCIGCGFCAGACPCGIWNLIENTPLA